mmetsp:Transcript_23207/g.54863  ORF Transcript_23207/g.54863 Transcript_23207/m.54863 type:complete len:418 (-) Transcript_23207:321-1574(-)
MAGGQDARRAAALWLPERAHAHRRAHRAVRAWHRRSDRHRREGDVRLRRPRRQAWPGRTSGAAPRDDRRCRAGRDRALLPARCAAAALLLRPDVPPRKAAEGPLPPVPPDGGRGPGLCGPRCRRRGHPDGQPAAARAGPAGGRACAPGAQLPGRSGRASRPPRGADRSPGAAQGPAGRRQPAPPVHQPAARAGHQEPGAAGHGECGAQAARLFGRGVAGPLQRRARHPRQRGHRLHDQPAPGTRSGLLQPDRVRVDHRQARVPGHGVRRRSLRRPDRAARWQARAGRRLRHGHRAHAVVAGGSRCHPRRAGARRLCHRARPGRHAAPAAGAGGPARIRRGGADARRWRLVQVAVQEGGRFRGPLRAGLRCGRTRPRRGGRQAAARWRRSGQSSPVGRGFLGRRTPPRIIPGPPSPFS